MRCGGCGYEAENHDVFCPNCGLRISGGFGVTAQTRRRSTGPATGPREGEGGEGEARARPDVPEPPTAAAQERAAETPTSEPGTVAEAANVCEPASQPPSAAAGKRNSGWAIASLVLGIAAFLVLPIVGGILAIVFAGLAKRDIHRSGGTVGGSGLATAGLTLGIIGVVVPVIASWVLIGWGFMFWRSGTAAKDNLVGGAEVARLYYFQNGNRYRGMDPARLVGIEENLDIRAAPGKAADVVYIDEVADQTARLYCYSNSGRKYIAAARGSQWRYNFSVKEGEDEERMFRLFDRGEP